MRDAFDRSGKWLLQNYGASILRLAGIQGVKRCRALPAEVVQPKQLPDGILAVELEGVQDEELFLVELATYPEVRLAEQVTRGAMLVYLAQRRLPEVVALLLRPRGNVQTPREVELESRMGAARLSFRWRVIELWKVPAAELLAAGDVGSLPWVPLMEFDDPPEAVLRQCRERIDREAPAEQRANLLAVTQVLTRLRYNEPSFLQIFGGSQAMIESPLIHEIVAQTRSESVVRVLRSRFQHVPEDLAARIESVRDEDVLDRLTDHVGKCESLDEIERLLSS